jgi:uncharacterized protein (TIGR03086 family)
MDQSNPVELLSQAVSTARPTLARVADEHLGLQTPCAEWNLRQLLQHIAGRAVLSERAARAVPVNVFPDIEADLLGAHPAAAVTDLLERSVAAWQRPSADPSATCITPLGEMPGFGLLTFQAQDVFVHTWDIATTIGHDPHFDDRLTKAMLELHQATITDDIRQMFFAPAVAVASTAPDLDRLIGFLGRNP